MTIDTRNETGPTAHSNAPFAESPGAEELIEQSQNDISAEVRKTTYDTNMLCEPTCPEREAIASPLRIMIVEDDLTIGPLLAEVLVDLGHVVCALETDAIAAVAAAKRYLLDLMIVDVGLGETSGIAAVKQILEQRFVPHVFVTGGGLRGLTLDADAVLVQKPYRRSDLVAAIAKATGRATDAP